MVLHEAYIAAYQALLAGESVDWEGAAIKLMLTSDQADVLPVRIPLLVGAIGPRGAAVAKRLGADGLMSMFTVVPAQRAFVRAVVATLGTVFADGEEPSAERVRAAIGAPWAATYHYAYTVGGADAVRAMPGGAAWVDVVEKVPQRLRHLSVHQGHMVEMNDADRAAWDAGGYVTVPTATLSGSADTVRKAVAAMAEQGATEIVIEPSGPDVERELTTFVAAVRG